MNNDNIDYLLATYPELYSNFTTNRADFSALGDGWFDILDSLSKAITSYAAYQQEQTDNAIRFNDLLKNNKIPGWWLKRKPVDTTTVTPFEFPRFDGFAEKFDTIQVYVSSNDETIHELIDQARAKSSNVCKHCGNQVTRDSETAVATCTSCNLH